MVFEFVFCAIFAAFSVFMTAQDIKTQKVSRWCSVALLVVSVAARLVFCVGEERVGFVASAAIGLLVFEAVRLVVKKRLGLADVFYSGSSGALLGFDMWLAACAIACVAAAGVIYLRVRKATHAMEEPRGVSKDARSPADGAQNSAENVQPSPARTLPSAQNPAETASAAHTVLTKDAALRMPVPFIPCMFLGAIISKIIYFFI